MIHVNRSNVQVLRVYFVLCAGKPDTFGGQAWANFQNAGGGSAAVAAGRSDDSYLFSLPAAILPSTSAAPASANANARSAAAPNAGSVWPSTGASAAPSAVGGGDKYAALAELDTYVKQSATTAPSPFAAQPYGHTQAQYAYEYPHSHAHATAAAPFNDPFNVIVPRVAAAPGYLPPVAPRPPHQQSNPWASTATPEHTGLFAPSARVGAGAFSASASGSFGAPPASGSSFDPFNISAPLGAGTAGSNPWASQQPAVGSSAFGNNAFAGGAAGASAFDSAGLFGAPASRPPDAFAAFGGASASAPTGKAQATSSNPFL